jgi:hypothetical protein
VKSKKCSRILQFAMHGYHAWTAQGPDVRRVAGGLVLVAAVTSVYFYEARSCPALPSRKLVQWQPLGS